MSYKAKNLGAPDNRMHVEINHASYGANAFPFNRFNSSPRMVMLAGHLEQSISLLNGTESRFQSGVQYDLGKYTFSVTAPCKLKILKVINKFPPGIGKNAIKENSETTLVYQDLNTGVIGSIVIPRYCTFHQSFGFSYIVNEEYRLVPGTVLEKGALIAYPPTKKKNGGYSLGVEVNVAGCSMEGTAEDGFIMNEDSRHKFAYKTYKKVVIEYGSNMFPLNMYGDVDNYKIHPEIGEYIREDGLVMCLRGHSPDLAITNICRHSTMEIDPYFDKPDYITGPRGKVIDITVYNRDHDKNSVPVGMDATTKPYGDATTSYHQRLYDYEKELTNNHRRIHGKNNPIKFEPKFRQKLLLSRAIIANSQGMWVQGRTKSKIELPCNKSATDVYRIEFIIEQLNYPIMGTKLTNSSGGKGTVVGFKPAADMPMDEDGIRADIAFGSESVVNRMNIGSGGYELVLGSVTNKVRKLIMDAVGASKHFNGYDQQPERTVKKWLKTLPIETLYNGIDVLMEYLNYISPRQYEFYKTITDEEVFDTILTIVYDKVYTYFPVDNPINVKLTTQMLNEKYLPTHGKVTMRAANGIDTITKSKVRIAPMDMYLLEKTATEDNSSVANAKTRSFGTIGQMSNSDKHRKPHKPTPTKVAGETETRGNLAYMLAEAMAEIYDRNNNPLASREIYKNILFAGRPNDIKNLINREEIPLGGGKPIEILKAMMTCAGFGYEYVPDENNYK